MTFFARAEGGSPRLGAGMGDPVVRGQLDGVPAAARKSGKPCGAACAAAAGHQFLIAGNDATMLARTAQSTVRGFREEVGS